MGIDEKLRNEEIRTWRILNIFWEGYHDTRTSKGKVVLGVDG